MLTDSFTANELWIEKYRPKSLDELVTDNEFKDKIKFYIEHPDKMPHQLFIGPPGSGKTTTARILIDNIIQTKSDLLVLNGSEQRGIQIIREHVLDFLKVPAIMSPIKLVFIDEADNLSPDAWKSLRFIMENYSETGRFIFTGNYDVFPDYIKSRVSVRKFTALPKDYVISFLESILQKENIQYNQQDVLILVDTFYPDLRKLVGAAQELSIVNKVLDISGLEQIMSDDEKLIDKTIQFMKAVLLGDNASTGQLLIDISNIISTRYIDYTKVFKTLFRKLSFEAVPLKVVISKYANKLSYALEPSMVYYEMIHELKNTLNELRGYIHPDNIIDNTQ